MKNTGKPQLSKSGGRGVGLDFQPGHRKASEGKKIKKINSSYGQPRRVLAPLPPLPQGARGLALMMVED